MSSKDEVSCIRYSHRQCRCSVVGWSPVLCCEYICTSYFPFSFSFFLQLQRILTFVKYQQSCISSAYSAQTSASSSAWPEPSAFCSGSPFTSVSSCLSSACSATPTAVSSYSSLASSLCSAWSSCSSAGSTGVYTLPWTTATGTAATTTTTTTTNNAKRFGPPGGGAGGGGGGFGPGNGQSGWGGWGSTFTGASVTITGCAWDGSPWMGGAGGSGWGGWGDWGAGWTWSTHTATVTATVTLSDGSVTTSTALAQVAEAVSGSVTSTTTLTGSAATATASTTSSGSSSSGGERVVGVSWGVVALGSVLGGLVGIIGVL